MSQVKCQCFTFPGGKRSEHKNILDRWKVKVEPIPQEKVVFDRICSPMWGRTYSPYVEPWMEEELVIEPGGIQEKPQVTSKVDKNPFAKCSSGNGIGPLDVE